jgi:CPA2 family monovalent cation:H+ antiporter-2
MTMLLVMAVTKLFGGSAGSPASPSVAPFAMSSTAILDQDACRALELDRSHGREIMGVLLFQDLAVVPLLIVIPSLTCRRRTGHAARCRGAQGVGRPGPAAGAFGKRMCAVVPRRRGAKSSELFVLNVLLVTLLLAWLTELAGLSLALGAFVAGMLISETEYRLQVEEDIKPFRDVLMGLFFVTIGVKLDLHIVVAQSVVAGAPWDCSACWLDQVRWSRR